MAELDTVYVENYFLNLQSYVSGMIFKALLPRLPNASIPILLGQEERDDTVQKRKFSETLEEKQPSNFRQLKRDFNVKASNARKKTVGKYSNSK